MLCAAAAIALPAQTFTTLHMFDAADGWYPSGGLVQGTDGNLYGTTLYGGTNTSCYATSCGTVFKITPSGTLTTLYYFCALGYPACTDGEWPLGLIQATNGDFYGTTVLGGANQCQLNGNSSGCGTAFKITPSCTLTTLHSFDGSDGQSPAGLIEAADGNFYGTTGYGGTNMGNAGATAGTVFKIAPSGMLTTLYSFCVQSGCTDGEGPSGALVQGTDGNFYGTTNYGGTSGGPDGFGGGTVFKITPNGTLTTLYTFCVPSGCTDGASPSGGLVQATNGYFYGTTVNGGANTSCIDGGCGTVFKITPNGTLTTLYSFCAQGGCADGGNPNGGLVQAANGDFYGTTSDGGVNCPHAACGGTIFKITLTGALTTLHDFCGQDAPYCPDGDNPDAGLLQASNGYLYGTTADGGANGNGTIFSLLVGLGPSAPAVNAGGVLNSASYTTQGVAPGSIVSIFGTNLASSTAVASAIPLPTALSDVTSVMLNNIPAGLYFVSQNQINAQLPFDVLLSGQDNGTVNIVVTRSSGTSAPENVTVVPASPGIFTRTANGLGQAFAYDNTTGALAAPAGAAIGPFTTAPISVSSKHALIVACTGLGSVTPSIDNYVAASDGILRNTLLQPTVFIGGVQAQFVYSVLSPQFVSEYQIGVVPDPATPTGDAVSLQIQIGGVMTTDQVTIAVAP